MAIKACGEGVLTKDGGDDNEDVDFKERKILERWEMLE